MCLAVTAAQGADVAISALPAASSVTGADVVPIVQSGTTKKASFTVQKSLWDSFYQPLDGDLTALAALTGTNTIYYRSAANTWTAVTVDSPLTFSGGHLGTSGTTVGKNFFTLTNPSAITFTRINADNTVTALNATDFRAAIGAGTGGGDFSSNTSTSVDSEVVLFSGTSGKTGKRATGSGIATLTSGVLSATSTTGSGNVVLATTPTITTPDFTTGFTIGTAAASGKIPIGNGTNYVASTPTFPNASASSGKIIKSDGTNWVASTETYAAPGTSGNVLTSDGTNWTSAAAAGGGGTTVKVTGSDFTTTNSTMTDITGLTFAATANKRYEVDVLLTGNGSDTNGCRFDLQYSAAGATGGFMIQGCTATGAVTLAAGAIGSGPSTNYWADTSTDLPMWLKTIISIGANTGNITVRVRKVTAGTVTVRVGSRMTVTQLN